MYTSKHTLLPLFLCLFLSYQSIAQQSEIEHISNGASPHLLLTETSTGFARLNFANDNKGLWTLAVRNGVSNADFNIFYSSTGTTGTNILSIDGDARRSIFESDVRINRHVTDPIMTFDVEGGNNAFINFEANAGSGLDGYIRYFAQQGGTAIPSYMEISAPGGDNFLSMFGGGSSTFGPSTLGSGGGGGARLRVVHNSTSDSPTLRLIEQGSTDFVRLFFTNQNVPDNRFQIASNPGSSNPRMDLGYNGKAIMTVDGDDDRVGVLDLTPEFTLSVDHPSGSPDAGAGFGLNIENTANRDNWTLYTRTNSDGDLRLYYDANSLDAINPVLRGTFNSSNGVYTNNSDVRLKKNISTIDNQLDKVLKLRPTKYQFNSQADNSYTLGLIAQEVQEVLPNVVNQITSIEEDGTDYLGIEYSSMIPVLVGAIQDQQELIKDLQKQVASLNDKIDKK